MDLSSLIVMLAAPLLGISAPRQGDDARPEWCCDLARAGHVVLTDAEALADRYAGWEPEAMAGRMWSLGIHQDHVLAEFHEAAHAAGRYESRCVRSDYPPEDLDPSYGAARRSVLVGPSHYEGRRSTLIEAEQRVIDDLEAEQRWLIDRLEASFLRWDPDVGPVPDPNVRRDEFVAGLEAESIECVVGMAWVREARAVACWRRFLALEFERGNFELMDRRMFGCGNTHIIDTLGFQSVSLPDGTLEHRRATATVADDDETRNLLAEWVWTRQYVRAWERRHEELWAINEFTPSDAWFLRSPPKWVADGLPGVGR